MKTEITPRIAKEMLTRNLTNNRNLSRSYVRKLAKQMKDGSWKYNGDPIRFDIDGNLVDGQHRLSAIVLSDKTQEMNVVEGLEKDSFFTIDSGKNRKMADHFAIDYKDIYGSHHQCSSLVKAVQMLVLHDSGKNIGRNAIRETTYSDVDEYLQNPVNREEAFYAANFIFQITRSRKLGTIMPSAIAIFLKVLTDRICINEFQMKKEEDFWKKLLKGVGLEEGHPVWCLRESFVRYKEVASNINCYIAPFTKAWNAYANGRASGTIYSYKVKEKDCQKPVKLYKIK
jgi:hypothetical protein